MKSILQLKRTLNNCEIEVYAFQFVCQKIANDSRKLEMKDGLAVMQRQLGLWQARLIKARQELSALKGKATR
jgi:hypothetical protein